MSVPALEWQEQVALFTWARLHEAREPRLAYLYHIPNGELRTKRTAARLHQMGVKPGVVDLHLPIPSTWPDGEVAYVGCWIELKRVGGATPSKNEQRWLNAMAHWGHNTSVCYGWLEAARHLCWYLQRKDLLKSLQDFHSEED